MSFDVVYVSPHADDVAFSAAAQLARDVAAGTRAAVLTVFDAGDRARRDEDTRFCEAERVALVEGGWPEAARRHRRYRKAPRLFAPLDAVERPLVEEVRGRLQALLDAGCRRVVAPLGVGQHVDHQVVHAAARQLRGADISYYEDTPYVLWRYQLPRRLARLGVAVEDSGDATLERGSVGQELTAAARGWMEAPLLDEKVPRPLRAFAVASLLGPEIRHWPRRSGAARARGSAERIEGDQVAVHKMRALACYATQWPLFFPSLEAWRVALDSYGRAIGGAGPVERRWRIAESMLR